MSSMIGKRLKRLRLENKLTQIALGKISGVSHVQIGRYENGFSKPRAKTLAKLAKALGEAPNVFSNKKKFPNEIFLEEHLERLKQVIKTDDDRNMLIAFTEILYHKNRMDAKKQNLSVFRKRNLFF